jgi:zinc protease
MIGFYGLPLNYLDKFTDEINQLTRDEVADALKRRINPKAMLTVIVGGEKVDEQSTKEQ